MEMKWVICPICKNKTRLKLRMDTIIDAEPYIGKCVALFLL